MGFNRVILMGRVCADARINDNRTVARYTLAVDKYGEGTDFIDCVAFGKQIDFVEKFVKKGIKLGVEGHIQTGSYEKDGTKVKTTDVVVERHEFCESKKAESNGFDNINAPIVQDDFMTIPEGIGENLPFN